MQNRMLPVSLPVCLLLRKQNHMLPVLLPACLLLHRLPVSLSACLLLRKRFRMQMLLPQLPSCSIRINLKVP
jgi:hypothetical protein